MPTCTNRILLIGSKSDLMEPLTQYAAEQNISILGISRDHWDLSTVKPNSSVLEEILRFSPNHVVFAAGVNEPTSIHCHPDSLLNRLQYHINVNCFAFISLVSHLCDYSDISLRSIHVISSLYGVYGRKERLPYSVSKHALEAAVKCLALELPDTVVMGYRPGFFTTKLTDKNLSLEKQKNIAKCIPLTRFGRPAELCSVIINNIVTPPAYASGSFITLDGGLTAGGIFNF